MLTELHVHSSAACTSQAPSRIPRRPIWRSATSRRTAPRLWRFWAVGAGLGDAPLTIGLDSTTCAAYGLKQQGALHPAHTPSYAGRTYDPSITEPAMGTSAYTM